MGKQNNKIKKNNKNSKNKIIKNNFISATSIRNFVLNDPIIDWLKYYKINDITDLPNSNRQKNKHEDKFLTYILKEGIKFENYIIHNFIYKTFLNNIFGNNIFGNNIFNNCFHNY